MADGTHIEWTEATWSPVTGCTRVSAGCDHCYIERTPPFRMAGRRFDKPGIGGTTGVQLHPDRLIIPQTWRKPRRIFVCSLADLFHDDVPDSFIARVFAVMARSPQHTFQLLTKRHARMRSLLRGEQFRLNLGREIVGLVGHLIDGRQWPWPLPNVWLGVSVENQQWADIRIPALLETPAAVRWLSCEPLLGSVDLYQSAVAPLQRFDDEPNNQAGRIDWVVVGGESGPGARPMHPDWARSLRDQCTGAGVPFFFKQWGEYGELPRKLSDGRYAMADPGVTVANDGTVYLPGELSYPDGSRYGEAIRAQHNRARLHAMYRVGKKAAGRELDGQTWEEFPR